MSTMQEVAKKAGVSKATVSRVLSGKGYTSEETKTLVYQAIEETGYRPNLLARNLATSKSACIGLVVTNTLYNGSYFNELLSQAAKKLEDNGRQLILVDGKHSADEERAAIQFLLGLRCDAIIIYPVFSPWMKWTTSSRSTSNRSWWLTVNCVNTRATASVAITKVPAITPRSI